MAREQYIFETNTINGGFLVDRRTNQIVGTTANGVDQYFVTGDRNPVTGGIELSAGSVEIPTIGSSYTWLGKPSASLMSGKTVRITDLNNTLWISDGTVWRPLNGRAVIAFGSGSMATPLATVAAAPGKLTLPAGANVISGSVLIPANLLAAGFSVEASVKLRKTGTGGTWAAAARIGTANAIGDSALVNTSGPATTLNDVWLLGQCSTISSSVMLSTGFSAPNSPTTSSFVDRNTNINTASDMYVSVFVTTLNAADSVALQAYEVAIIA